MKATSSRRQLIVFVLLGFAVLGGAMRLAAPDPSLARDVGTLLLVLWLPVVGNVVAFLIARLRRPPRAPVFEPAEFTPQLLVELTRQMAVTPPPPPDEHICTLVIGNEGFTARLPVPVAQWLASGELQVPVQFVRPALALGRFPVDARFKVLVGRSLAGTGRVVQPAI